MYVVGEKLFSTSKNVLVQDDYYSTNVWVQDGLAAQMCCCKMV
jgi:hypothetical protein